MAKQIMLHVHRDNYAAIKSDGQIFHALPSKLGLRVYTLLFKLSPNPTTNKVTKEGLSCVAG